MKIQRPIFTALLLWAVCFLYSGPVKAQQDAMFSQYMFNGLAINPAYAGSKDYLAASILHRNQWVDIPGAPVTNTVSIHSPIIVLPGSNVGATMVHDKIGFTTQTDFFANYAYRIDLGKGGRLSMGLRAGFSNYKVDFSRVTTDAGIDPVVLERQNGLAPNVGTGIYFDTRTFYLGFSVPRLLSYHPEDVFSIDDSGLPKARRHYFGTVGYAWEVSQNVVIKPSVLAKYETAAPFQTDFNLNVLLVNRLWLGASYRTNDAVVGMIEFLPTRGLQIGYAYDFTVSELAQYNRGTHEFVLTVNLGGNVSKLKTPRYF